MLKIVSPESVSGTSRSGLQAARLPGAPTPAPVPSFGPGRAAPDTAEWRAREPEVRVSKEFAYGPKPSWWQKLKSKVQATWELFRSEVAPGIYIARKSHGGKQGIRVIRRERFPDEEKLPVSGISKPDRAWVVQAVPNPGSPDGTFDPYRYMPSLVFHPKEDSFPVAPDLDGDGDLLTDARNYRHGVIGGLQPLSGAFHVSKKGEFTVLTYSLYYVDNKQATYHLKDSSTLSVYLKPGNDGRLQPEYLYTSWHYAGNLAKWADLKKDGAGRPIVEVERGSHALHPLGRWERPWKSGVRVSGDGSVAHGGVALQNRFDWVSFQPGITGTTPHDPAGPRGRALMDAYFATYPERRNPIHPTLFEQFAKRPAG